MIRLKTMARRYEWRLNDEKERGPAQVLDLLGIEIDAPYRFFGLRKSDWWTL